MKVICSSIFVYTYINTHKHTTNCFTLLGHYTSIHLSLRSVLALSARVFPMSLIQTRSLTKAHWGFFAGCMSCCLPAKLTVVQDQPGGKCGARLTYPLSLDIFVIYSCSGYQFCYHKTCVLANFLIVSLNRGKLILKLFFLVEFYLFPLDPCVYCTDGFHC